MTNEELRVEAKMVRDALVDICDSVFKDPIEGLVDGEGNILIDGVIIVSESFVADENTALVGIQQFKAGWDISVVVEEEDETIKAESIDSTSDFEIMTGVVIGLVLAKRAHKLQEDWAQKINLTVQAEIQKMEGKSH